MMRGQSESQSEHNLPFAKPHPLSYCCYVCQAFRASIDLTLSLTALTGKILSIICKNKKAQTEADRKSLMISTGSQSDSAVKTG